MSALCHFLGESLRPFRDCQPASLPGNCIVGFNQRDRLQEVGSVTATIWCRPKQPEEFEVKPRVLEKVVANGVREKPVHSECCDELNHRTRAAAC